MSPELMAMLGLITAEEYVEMVDRICPPSNNGGWTGKDRELMRREKSAQMCEMHERRGTRRLS
jgi:hypothetical protein